MKYSNEQRKKDNNEMLNILHQNHDAALTKNYIERMIKDDELKFAKKRRVRFLVEIITIILIFIVALSALVKLDRSIDKDWLEKCTSENSKDYCEEILAEINYE